MLLRVGAVVNLQGFASATRSRCRARRDQLADSSVGRQHRLGRRNGLADELSSRLHFRSLHKRAPCTKCERIRRFLWNDGGFVEHQLGNAETSAGDAADLVAALLGSAPGVAMLATSRERLMLRAEQVYPLGGLDVPGTADPSRSSAVILFVQRAFLPLLLALPAIALMLAEQGPKRAVELYALAWRHPVIASVRGFIDSFGRRLDAAVAALRPTSAAAAQARGRLLNLWGNRRGAGDRVDSTWMEAGRLTRNSHPKFKHCAAMNKMCWRTIWRGRGSGLVHWWLEKRQPHTPETIARIFQRLQRAAIRDAFGLSDAE